jgi:serine/threonine protein kinase
VAVFDPKDEPVSQGELILHYEVEGRLGAGGMGVVFRALDRKLKRHVALKFLPSARFLDDVHRERLLREATAASALDHANIGAVHSIEETPDGRLFIVMPCYPGETLKQLMDRGPLPWTRAVGIALQAARGLAKAHETGIIHRDIKPSNLILTPDGTVKIVDFGLAKISGGTDLTETGATMGTAAYMSPEQAAGRMVDYHTDIWSLGVVLYEMLRGERPFHGEGTAALLYAVVHTEAAPLSGVPKPLEQIVRKCMAKAPQERYGSMAQLIHALEGLQERHATNPTGSSTVTLSLPPGSDSRRRLVRWSAAAFAVLVLAAGSDWLWVSRQKHVVSQKPALPEKPSAGGSAPNAVAPPPPPVIRSNPPAAQPSPPAAVRKPAQNPVKKSAAPPPDKTQEPQVSKSPKEGRIVWTGDLDPGQEIDLTAKQSAGSISGALPGVPVSIEVHPTSVKVVTPPGDGNQWRRLVLRNDGKKQAVVIVVNWAVIPH